MPSRRSALRDQPAAVVLVGGGGGSRPEFDAARVQAFIDHYERLFNPEGC